MEQTPSPTTPEPISPPQAHPIDTPVKKQSLKLPIILMAWPGAAIIASIVLYSIVNFIFSGATTSDPEQLFSSGTDTIRVIINVVLFVVGAAAVLAGPFSFIGGLILLVIRIQNRQHHATQQHTPAE